MPLFVRRWHRRSEHPTEFAVTQLALLRLGRRLSHFQRDGFKMAAYCHTYCDANHPFYK
jgi:hypothetical protein